MRASMDDARLTNVEIKLMHLEEQLEDMNTVVLQQAETIKRLKAKLKETQSKIEIIASDAQDDGDMSSIERMAQDKPPHY